MRPGMILRLSYETHSRGLTGFTADAAERETTTIKAIATRFKSHILCCKSI